MSKSSAGAQMIVVCLYGSYKDNSSRTAPRVLKYLPAAPLDSISHVLGQQWYPYTSPPETALWDSLNMTAPIHTWHVCLCRLHRVEVLSWSPGSWSFLQSVQSIVNKCQLCQCRCAGSQGRFQRQLHAMFWVSVQSRACRGTSTASTSVYLTAVTGKVWFSFHHSGCFSILPVGKFYNKNVIFNLTIFFSWTGND